MLEQSLRDIAQTVIADADLAVALSDSPVAGATLDDLNNSIADLGFPSPRSDSYCKGIPVYVKIEVEFEF